MADQGSIWLQMVIIAAAAILLPLKQQRLSASHPCVRNSPAHLVIVFVWPGKLTDAQVKFSF